MFIMEIKLSNRLMSVYNLIPDGARVIDVGTDHGYIPVCLALEGKGKSIVASDIRSGPLERARFSAEKYGVAVKIDFVLTDGLSGFDRDSADCVVIAGMGGETIIRILQAAPWTKNAGKTLVLQPQSKSQELCLWLFKNGYSVKDAALTKDEGKYYVAMKVTSGHEAYASKAALIVHPQLLKNRDPLLPEYIDGLISKLSRSASGMERAKATDRRAEAEDMKAIVTALRAIREEIGKWPL
ncbi:MAG: tRNA (adenine(22)-N(1))-methyltransferase TrmK [Oscillospiraceae bacterium]